MSRWPRLFNVKITPPRYIKKSWQLKSVFGAFKTSLNEKTVPGKGHLVGSESYVGQSSCLTYTCYGNLSHFNSKSAEPNHGQGSGPIVPNGRQQPDPAIA
jgi:hypothetical protein